MPRRDLLLAAAAVTPVAIAVFWDGGYSAAPRVAFGVVALVAAGIALAIARRDSRAATLRQPVVLVLVALAAVGALSALWTIGPVDRTLRWALVTAGYAAVAVAATVAASRPRGTEALAGAVAALAAVAGAIGLGAAVLFEPPYAERIVGVWRPGGPSEYPPALALLQVSALPVLLAGMAVRSRIVTAAAAGGVAVAGGVIALSASRLSLALAVAVGGLALVRAPRRAPVAAALALCFAAGLALQLACGDARPAGAGVEPGRVLALVGVVIGAAAVWLAAARVLGKPAAATRRHPPLAPVAAIAAAAILAGSLAFGLAPGQGAGPDTGFLHGRADTWSAAVSTFTDRPTHGTGADAFLAGSVRHQDGQTILFAHNLPLELAAELGLAGLALALALYAATAIQARRGPWLLVPAAAAFPVANLVDWPWHLAGSGAIWALAIGAIAGTRNQPTKVPPPIRKNAVQGAP